MQLMIGRAKLNTYLGKFLRTFEHDLSYSPIFIIHFWPIVISTIFFKKKERKEMFDL